MDDQWYQWIINDIPLGIINDIPPIFHDIPLVYKPITRSILDGYKLILTSHGTPVIIHFRLGCSMKIQVPKDDLVGGDWNHGVLNDFPDTVGNVIIPTDELTPSFFRGVGLNHQPVFRLGCSMKIHEINHPASLGQQHWWKLPHVSVAMETSWDFFSDHARNHPAIVFFTLRTAFHGNIKYRMGPP